MSCSIVAQNGIYIHTLGCPKNDADSRTLSRALTTAGVRVVDDPSECSHVLLNTCGFIQDAKEESIAAILNACASYSGRVFVMGCLVERYRRELEAGIPEVAGWFGLAENDRLIGVLRCVVGPTTTYTDTTHTDLCPAAGTQIDRGLPYAYVKISDGCDEPCTFCAIPAIKGPYHSVDTASILADVDACLDAGVREIILVGQDTAIWQDGDRDLTGLLDLVLADERVRRLRIMYLQPEHVSDTLLHYMADEAKMCRYLDLPFQHADAEVLRRMGRRGEGGAYRALVSRARRLMPDVSVRSTFIVGFPGETEEQFEVLMEFVDDIGFDHAGGFIYSPEEGTCGALLRPRVKKQIALDRLNRLNALVVARAQAEHGRLIDSCVDVMIDVIDPSDDQGVAAVGRTEGQAPDVDGVTYIEGDLPTGVGPGDIVRATIIDAVGHDLIARCDAS
ncbi:MAG: 30S ribosomal protein S12 methylthiotransferase RimO [Thermoleophilia bacterium]|jgi:ribosomal protein S12 methylthiotransferase